MRLFDFAFSEDALRAAWLCTRSRSQSPGIDRIRPLDFEQGLNRNLRRLRSDILRGTYQPSPTRQVKLQKPNGGFRPIEIFTVRDRVAQRAALTALSLVLDGAFHDGSFGFRPHRGVQTAVYRVHYWRLRYHDRYALRTDIERCFESIDHDRLLHALREMRIDAPFRQFIQACLAAAPRGKRECGLPQGGPLSPLLCNAMLDPIDWEVTETVRHFARYADDYCLSFPTRRQAEDAQAILESRLAAVGLAIQPEKTALVSFAKGFRFLGGEFKANHLRPCVTVRNSKGVEKLTYAYDGPRGV